MNDISMNWKRKLILSRKMKDKVMVCLYTIFVGEVTIVYMVFKYEKYIYGL